MLPASKGDFLFAAVDVEIDELNQARWSGGFDFGCRLA